MATVNIKGDIIPNDLAWAYEWFGFDHTSPAMVKTVIDGAAEGETIDVIINSGGGYVMAGQEIYTELTKNPNVNIEIQSLAGSAASVIAMAGHSRISPVGMIMIHNVSGRSEGDYHDMQKSAEILKNMNAALANAYVQKTGMDRAEVLRLMDKETWLTANQCVEMGFCDEIMGEEEEPMLMTASLGLQVTPDMIEKAKAEMAQQKELEELREITNILVEIDES